MNRLLGTLLLFLWLTACAQPPSRPTSPAIASSATLDDASSDPYATQRDELVAEIKALGVTDEAVLNVMARVPRHEFVPPEYLDQAYADHPLPIGYGQTISQPYIVAWMTEQLELLPGEKVLEVGTGSGYQAAVLAEMGAEVYTIEIVPQLARSAASRLQSLDYAHVHATQGDGYYGWPEYAPFDAIIVTAAPDHLPAPLVEQLLPDGRLVIPIGPQGWVQSLWKFVLQDGELKGYNLGGVRFVPFTGAGVEEQARQSTATP